MCDRGSSSWICAESCRVTGAGAEKDDCREAAFFFFGGKKQQKIDEDKGHLRWRTRSNGLLTSHTTSTGMTKGTDRRRQKGRERQKKAPKR